MEIWAIYDHPLDFPKHFIARKFIIDRPTTELIISNTLENIREQLLAKGFVRLDRSPSDDPKIVEVWI
jgi:hypothetical protein